MMSRDYIDTSIAEADDIKNRHNFNITPIIQTTRANKANFGSSNPQFNQTMTTNNDNNSIDYPTIQSNLNNQAGFGTTGQVNNDFLSRYEERKK